MKCLPRQKCIIICIMMSILLVQLIGILVSPRASATERKVILFDEVHLQYYTSERMQSAITSLNNTEDYIVIINRQRFTETSLLGVDILVIGNPERSFNTQETLAIAEYLKNGGNLFLLGDPRGKSSNLNDVLNNAKYTDARFSQHIIFDEENNLNNISKQIIVSREELRESSPIVNDVNEIVTNAIWIEDSDPTKVIATGSNDSFAGLEGRAQPAWLVASIVGRSRIVLCGSTLMFSEIKPAKSEITWYQSRDNARLWHNIFLWLAQREITPSFLDTITLSAIAIVVVSLVIGIVFIGGGLSVYYLFQRKELKPISEILRKKKIEKPEPVPKKKEIPIPEEEAIPSPEVEVVPTEKKPTPPPEKKIKKKGKKRIYRIRR